MKDLIRKYVLINAVEHDGEAISKSVLGKILGDNPKLRSNVLQIKSEIEIETDNVNKLTLAQQKKELKKLGGYQKRIVEEKKELIDLPDARIGSFVVRFAPNPDGALHLGNARQAVLNNEYAKKYKGKFILRFDDTDPKIKVPEKKFYTWIKQDLRWLGIKYHKEIIASKRLSIYYAYAEKLIRLGQAYVCTCNDMWKKMRDKEKACPCRETTPNSNLSKWRKMLKHKFREQEAVLRVKTDMKDRNPAVRDWPAFRIVDNPKHPLVKGKYVWPLMNFQSAIDDHLMKVTHILRGQEHTTNQLKQEYLYQHFGWDYPISVTVGRFSMSDTVLSKSHIKEGIERGIYHGWDDVQLGTLKALRRRGFQPDAIRKMIVDIGTKPSDVTVSFENLSSYNRKIIDKMANRYYFVPQPTKIEVKNPPTRKLKLELHPDNKSAKKRTFVLGKTFYIDADDFKQYKDMEIRLKGLYNIKLERNSVFTTKKVKNIPKIQWVPGNHLTVRVISPKKMIKGYGESNLKRLKIDDIVQFERFGFVRIEKKGKDSIVVVFAHE